MTGCSYKTTAKALQGRRLVTAGVRAGAWRAGLTDAGLSNLEHGCYPPGLWREPPSRDGRAAGRALARFTPARPPAVAKPPAGPPEPSGPAARVQAIDELAADLVARVVAAGSVLEADDSLAGDAGERLVAASRHVPGLPFGKQLRMRSRGVLSRARQVYLDEDFSVRVAEQPVPVPQRVTRLHPAVAAYRDDADRHEVSRDSLSRATRLLARPGIRGPAPRPRRHPCASWPLPVQLRVHPLAQRRPAGHRHRRVQLRDPDPRAARTRWPPRSLRRRSRPQPAALARAAARSKVWADLVARRFLDIAPMERERAIIYGDFTNDNVIASGTPQEATGVVDFALAHVEHPLADIGYACGAAAVRPRTPPASTWAGPPLRARLPRRQAALSRPDSGNVVRPGQSLRATARSSCSGVQGARPGGVRARGGARPHPQGVLPVAERCTPGASGVS
jgi:Phosphotransferase enzyme family